MKIKSQNKLIPNFKEKISSDDYLLIKNLKFKYPQNSNDTIHSIIFKIDKGNKIVITSKIGSGKNYIYAFNA